MTRLVVWMLNLIEINYYIYVMPSKKPVISLRVSDELDEWINKLIKGKETSKSEFIIKILEMHMKFQQGASPFLRTFCKKCIGIKEVKDGECINCGTILI